MYTDSLPPASIYADWTQDIEVFSADDDTSWDFSNVTEVVLRVIDTYTKFVELQLTMTNGNIVLPAPGIVQWFADASVMGTMRSKLYQTVLTFEYSDGSISELIVGPLSIVE